MDRSIALAIVALVLGISIALTPYILYINNISSSRGTTVTTIITTAYPATTIITTAYPAQASREYVDKVHDVLGYLLESKTLLNILSAVHAEPIFLAMEAIPTPAPIAVAKSELAMVSGERVSETNVQVVGVDELDIVKTDGKIIAVVSGSNVYIVSVKDKEVLSVLKLAGDIQGIFLYNNTLVAVSQVYAERFVIVGIGQDINVVVPRWSAETIITIASLSNPREPEIRFSLRITGYVVGARRVDNYVYLVLSQGIDYELVDNKTLILPLINGTPIDVDKVHKVDPIPTSYANIVIVDVSRLEYNVESFLVSRGSRIYMTFSRLYIASDEVPFQVVVRMLLNASLDLIPRDIANSIYEYVRLGKVDEAYQTLVEYLAKIDRETRDSIVKSINDRLSDLDTDLTRVYVFDVDKLSIDLRGVITASGHLLDQFAIEEHNNTLILATTASNLRPKLVVSEYLEYIEYTPSYSEKDYIKDEEWSYGRGYREKTLTIPPRTTPSYRPKTYVWLAIEPSGEQDNRVYIYDVESLELLGKLEGLAEGERVYAARVVKNILFLVTFRQVDPLFAIDIGDPRNPRVLGFLKIPGFSEYLHPLPNDMLLGIGLEDGKLKISLFDVSDPTHMKEVSKIYISAHYYSYSEALQDHKAVTVDIEFGRIYFPVDLLTFTRRFSGIAVVQVRGEVLELLSILEHDDARRAVYVGNELFTVSHNSIKVYDYWSLEQIGEIVLSM